MLKGCGKGLLNCQTLSEFDWTWEHDLDIHQQTNEIKKTIMISIKYQSSIILILLYA